MADTVYAPNEQGHNFIPFGGMMPGVSTLIRLELFDKDPVTGEYTVVRNVTGWTSPRVRFFSVTREPVAGEDHEDHKLLLEFAAAFDLDPLLGAINLTVTAEHKALLVQDGRHYGVSIDAISPSGDRELQARGSAYLLSGAP